MDEINLFELMEKRNEESRKEHKLLHERVSNMKDELLAEIKEIRREQEFINKEMEKRVSALERWKWTLAGAGAVIMFFVMGGQEIISKFVG